MTVGTYTIMNIRFNEEEREILEQTLDILRKVNREIDECPDVDEARLSDNWDIDLLNRIENELSELGCSIEF